MSNLIKISNLTVSYQMHPALHHLDFTIPVNQATVIIGPNGAGKTTFLKTLMGFVQAEHGHIDLPIPKSQIAYLPQQSEIDRSLPLSVFELAATGLYQSLGLWSGVKKDAEQKIQAALKVIGLENFENRSIQTLSNGQFQRVLFARILLQKAQLILLDEPFNAIDAKTTQDLCQLIQQWTQQGKTVIAVVHDYHQAKQYFDYGVLLARELIYAGDIQDVITDEKLTKAYSTMLNWQEDAPWCE